MKERGIIMQGESVRGILPGIKKMTRRVAKLPRNHTWGSAYDGQIIFDDGSTFGGELSIDELRCPYGQPGDRLWVKETFSGPHCMEATEGRAAVPPSKWGQSSPIWYWADGNPESGDWTKPRPSIFMPRWASRILLEITDIRVERLQDISEEDAIAEGCFALGDYECTAVRQYRELWERINGAGSWDANPYTWIIEFARTE